MVKTWLLTSCQSYLAGLPPAASTPALKAASAALMLMPVLPVHFHRPAGRGWGVTGGFQPAPPDCLRRKTPRGAGRKHWQSRSTAVSGTTALAHRASAD